MKGRSGARRGRTGAPVGADALIERPEECIRLRREPGLFGLQRLTAEIAGLVKSRQKCEANAGDACGVAYCFPKRVRAQIGEAAFLAVQVVKFGHRGVALLEHLDE